MSKHTRVVASRDRVNVAKKTATPKGLKRKVERNKQVKSILEEQLLGEFEKIAAQYNRGGHRSVVELRKRYLVFEMYEVAGDMCVAFGMHRVAASEHEPDEHSTIHKREKHHRRAKTSANKLIKRHAQQVALLGNNSRAE